jgi:hypothetical protein
LSKQVALLKRGANRASWIRAAGGMRQGDAGERRCSSALELQLAGDLAVFCRLPGVVLIAILAVAWLVMAIALAVPGTLCAESPHPHSTCPQPDNVRAFTGVMMMVLGVAALIVMIRIAWRQRADSGTTYRWPRQ